MPPPNIEGLAIWAMASDDLMITTGMTKSKDDAWVAKGRFPKCRGCRNSNRPCIVPSFRFTSRQGWRRLKCHLCYQYDWDCSMASVTSGIEYRFGDDGWEEIMTEETPAESEARRARERAAREREKREHRKQQKHAAAEITEGRSRPIPTRPPTGDSAAAPSPAAQAPNQTPPAAPSSAPLSSAPPSAAAPSPAPPSISSPSAETRSQLHNLSPKPLPSLPYIAGRNTTKNHALAAAVDSAYREDLEREHASFVSDLEILHEPDSRIERERKFDKCVEFMSRDLDAIAAQTTIREPPSAPLP